MYKAFCLACLVESDILSVEILSISERQQPLTGSCNGIVKFTTMLVLRMPLQAARKVKGEGGTSLDFHAVNVT